MPHPPHKLADGSADTHADGCPRCKWIRKRWFESDLSRPFVLAGNFAIPLYELQRIDAQMDAEDEAERADEARLRDLQNACGVDLPEVDDEKQ